MNTASTPMRAAARQRRHRLRDADQHHPRPAASCASADARRRHWCRGQRRTRLAGRWPRARPARQQRCAAPHGSPRWPSGKSRPRAGRRHHRVQRSPREGRRLAGRMVVTHQAGPPRRSRFPRQAAQVAQRHGRRARWRRRARIGQVTRDGASAPPRPASAWKSTHVAGGAQELELPTATVARYRPRRAQRPGLDAASARTTSSSRSTGGR